MAQSIKGRINSWYTGLSEDFRIQDLSSYQYSVGFDIFANYKKLTPILNTEDDSTNSGGSKGDCAIHRFLSVGGNLYGYGRKSAASPVTKIYIKNGGMIAGSWQAATNGEATVDTPTYQSFISYHNWIYGYQGLRYIWAFSVAGSAFQEHAFDLTSMTIGAQGIVTSNDLLLMPHDNKIAVKDGGTSYNDNWEAARLTLPSAYTIMDLEEFGSLIAITCKPTNASEVNSKVFLWDGVSPDISESIDLGEGIALLSATIDGELYSVIVSPEAGNNVSVNNSIIVRKYLGGKSSEVTQLIPTESFISQSSPLTSKMKDGNGVSWVMDAKLNATNTLTLFKLAKKKSGYPVALSSHMNPSNDTQASSVEGAYKLGSYYFFAINADGTVVRTNDNATYTATAIFISQKINGEFLHVSASRSMRGIMVGQSRFDKVLKWAGITCPPLPAGSTISLYYRTDATTSWTKIFDYTTTNGQVYQQGIDASGADFINFKEIQFKLTTVGGTSLPAEWCSIDYEYELLTAPTEE